ncbi:MAG: RluA family pseudouridine synthase [Alphaproteobacteria bacterium]|nr:RluA family pseudouridine synthase [Alphaproteobacteria bacterium]
MDADDDLLDDAPPDDEAGRGAPSAAGDVRTAACDAAEAGTRIDAFLARAFPDLSRARIQGLIGQGRLTRDGAPVTAASEKTRPGLYALRLPPPEPAAPEPENIPLAIVFEDAHLVVIDKAAGMAMHPAPGAMRGTLVHALLHHCRGGLSGVGGVARPGIVHRIDKDTTGLVVVAKDDVTHTGLAAQFAKHTIERAYFAVTRGAPPARSGTIETRLARSGDDRRKMAVVRDPRSEAGKRAVTHYWLVETFGHLAGAPIGHPAAALVECRLETGRTHQIRAHLAHLGAPLLGDPLYGKFRGLKIEGAGPAVDAAKEAAAAFPRQALHAAVLGFTHPVTGAAHRFESPLPADIQGLLAALRRV